MKEQSHYILCQRVLSASGSVSFINPLASFCLEIEITSEIPGFPVANFYNNAL